MRMTRGITLWLVVLLLICLSAKSSGEDGLSLDTTLNARGWEDSGNSPPRMYTLTDSGAAVDHSGGEDDDDDDDDGAKKKRKRKRKRRKRKRSESDSTPKTKKTKSAHPHVEATSDEGEDPHWLSKIPKVGDTTEGKAAGWIKSMFKLNKETNKWVCQVLNPNGRRCNREYTKQGSSTGNLHRHLRKDDSMDHPAKSYATDVPTKGGGLFPKRGQIAIQAFMSFPPEKTQKCHEALVLMCAIDNRPYYMVGCHGFRYFINAISGGRYTPPSRATIRVLTASMAGQIMETTTTIITEDVKDGAVIHLTFDAWTDSANRQFLSVNAFWVRPKEYKWIQRHLAIRVFPGSHTAEATANLIRDIMGEYAIPEDAFKYACTDNCSVMTAIFDHHFVNTTRIFCAPHWMQLVIKDALQDANFHCDQRLDDFISMLNRSPKITHHFNQMQISLSKDGEPLKMMKEVPTRWCSKYLKIERAVYLREPCKQFVAELLGNGQEAHLKLSDFTELALLGAVLRPFFESTTVLEGDKDVSISGVYPELRGMMDALDPEKPLVLKEEVVGVDENGDDVTISPEESIDVEKLPANIKEFRERLRHSLVHRWGSESKVSNLSVLYKVATALDYRYRDTFKTSEEREYVKRKLIEMSIDLYEEKDEEERQQGSSLPSAPPLSAISSTAKPKVRILSQAEQRAARLRKDSSPGMKRGRGGSQHIIRRAKLESDLILEVNEYFKIDTNIEEPISPIDWWASLRGSFKHLSVLAARLLSIPASSASVERVFSQAGLTLNKLRTRLGTKQVENLFIIKYGHMLHQEYNSSKSEGGLYYSPRQWMEMQEDEKGGEDYM